MFTPTTTSLPPAAPGAAFATSAAIPSSKHLLNQPLSDSTCSDLGFSVWSLMEMEFAREGPRQKNVTFQLLASRL